MRKQTKPGCPVVGKEPLTRRIFFQLSDSDYNRMQDIIGTTDMYMSEWVRNVVREKINEVQ
jgi:hypothetical protein